jgi:hypothetical protein
MLMYYVFEQEIRRQRDLVLHQCRIIVQNPGYVKSWNTEYFECVELYFDLN